MPGLLIKNLPPDLHQLLKEDAERHHRSMTRHALTLIEKGLRPTPPALQFPKPVRLRKPLSSRFVEKAIRESRG